MPGRPGPGGVKSRQGEKLSKGTRPTTADVRRWGQATFEGVGDRGILPRDVIEAFNKSHPRRTYIP